MGSCSLILELNVPNDLESKGKRGSTSYQCQDPSMAWHTLNNEKKMRSKDVHITLIIQSKKGKKHTQQKKDPPYNHMTLPYELQTCCEHI